MEKKFSDEELDRLLEEQYLKEADMIAEELFSDELEGFTDETEEETDAAYAALVEKLKADGIYREESANSGKTDKRDAESGKDTVICPDDCRRTGRKGLSFKTVRAAGFAVVCVLGVLAASMTGEANRKYFIENMRYLTGDTTKMVVSNDKKNEYIDESEYKARKEAKDKLGIEMPEFFYIPSNFEFYDCEIGEINKMVVMKYKYKDEIISLVGFNEDSNKNSINLNLHGKQIATAKLKTEESVEEVGIIEIKEDDDKIPNYSTQWEYKDTGYRLSGKMEKKEFIKLVEKIKFVP